MNSNKILVIDDELPVRESYQSILCSQGYDPLSELEQLFDDDSEVEENTTEYEVCFAAQGNEGVTLAEQAFQQGEPFAIAFIDMRMPPGMDGLETAKQLRAIDSKIQVIFVTAYSDRSVDELDDALGTDMLLLRKPFTSDEVLQLARNSLRNWNHLRQVEWQAANSEETAKKQVDMGQGIVNRVNEAIGKVQNTLNEIRKAQEQMLKINERLQVDPKDRDQDKVKELLQSTLSNYHEHAISQDLNDASVTLKRMSSILQRQRDQQYGTLADATISIYEAIEEALLVFSDRLARSDLELNLQLQPEVGGTEYSHKNILQLLNTLLYIVIDGVEQHALELDVDDHMHTSKGRSILISADSHDTQQNTLELHIANDNLNSMHNNQGQEYDLSDLQSLEPGLQQTVEYVKDLQGHIYHYQQADNHDDQSFQVTLPTKS